MLIQMVDFSLAAPVHYSAAKAHHDYAPRSKCPSLLLLFRLLYSVLPPSVANELRHKRPVPAKRYDNVTILFSGIVGFNAFCSKHASAEGAIKIVNLLNDVYTRFDILTDSRNNPYVYKVGSRDFTMTAHDAFVYIYIRKRNIKGEQVLHICTNTDINIGLYIIVFFTVPLAYTHQ